MVIKYYDIDACGVVTDDVESLIHDPKKVLANLIDLLAMKGIVDEDEIRDVLGLMKP